MPKGLDRVNCGGEGDRRESRDGRAGKMAALGLHLISQTLSSIRAIQRPARAAMQLKTHQKPPENAAPPTYTATLGRDSVPSPRHAGTSDAVAEKLKHPTALGPPSDLHLKRC
ncbi:hypothetical protein VP1G_11145 [Cytospora mali]|uniref:Uncharacterized protein n=1 Tax=Cytospora mali TaxID=578113 RepID=A0A194V5E0_CYTMA|nr:hypothetical protein VP1G_11145 [Valsa mali var. pyri (nom. inval.)]